MVLRGFVLWFVLRGIMWVVVISFGWRGKKWKSFKKLIMFVFVGVDFVVVFLILFVLRFRVSVIGVKKILVEV